MRAIGLILGFRGVGYTFESQLSAVDTFTVKCDYRTDGIEQPIYVEGYLLIPTADVAATEDWLNQSLSVLLHDFRFTLVNVAGTSEYFSHRQGSGIYTKEVLYGFWQASDDLVP